MASPRRALGRPRWPWLFLAATAAPLVGCGSNRPLPRPAGESAGAPSGTGGASTSGGTSGANAAGDNGETPASGGSTPTMAGSAGVFGDAGAPGFAGMDSGGADSGTAGAGGDDAPPPPGAEVLYDPATLATFELTIPEACREALQAEPTEYCEGAVTYRPPAGPSLTFPLVGIRLKGRATMQPLTEKPSFKIKLDEYLDGPRLFGTRRLTLNNMVQDPSMAHEVLGYRYYRAVGVPAPLCNYARVVVDGEPYGLYANLETVDDEFAESRFDPAPGNLYDTSNEVYFVDFLPEWLGSFELETNHDAPDTSDLEALIAAVGAPAESFYAEVGAVLDWDEVLTLGAAQAVVADWDGYFGAANNYELYHELARDRFLLIPWGIDQTFGTADGERGEPLAQLEYAVDHSTSGRENGVLFRRCREDDACWADYLARLQTALEVWNGLPLLDELEAALELTADARAEDTRRPYGDARSEEFVEGLRTFLVERGPLVEAQLAEFTASR